MCVGVVHHHGKRKEARAIPSLLPNAVTTFAPTTGAAAASATPVFVIVARDVFPSVAVPVHQCSGFPLRDVTGKLESIPLQPAPERRFGLLHPIPLSKGHRIRTCCSMTSSADDPAFRRVCGSGYPTLSCGRYCLAWAVRRVQHCTVVCWEAYVAVSTLSRCSSVLDRACGLGSGIQVLRGSRTCLHVLHGCVEGVKAKLGLELGVLLPPSLPSGKVLAVRVRRLRRVSFARVLAYDYIAGLHPHNCSCHRIGYRMTHLRRAR